MNVRWIPRAAVGVSLRLARLPFDMAIAVLPVGRQRTKLAVDRADAMARGLAGTVLADDALRVQARRKRSAADQRSRGAELRERAQRTARAADDRVQQRQQQASRRRRGADERARDRVEQAEARRTQRSRQAAQAESRRREASRQAERRSEERIQEQARRERLEVLDEAVGAQEQRRDALTAQDEAMRLREAAARVKEERKEQP